MPSFCSFLVFEPRQTDLVTSLCSQAGWNSRFIPDPSQRFRFHKTGFSEFTHPDAVRDLGPLGDGDNLGQLLILEAAESDADNIIKLISSAHVVISGFPDRRNRTLSGFELPNATSEQTSEFKHIFQTTGFFEWFTYEREMPVAVAIAAKAWSDKQLIYAIHKLSQSYETESITPWSAHPRYGQIFAKHSDQFSDHVRTSIAINLAHSAIEELGLDIRSSKQNPRWLDNTTFEWNPSVLASIEDRLKQSGIDPKATVDWIARGDETEPAIHPKRNTLAAHSDGQSIRDTELSLPDAIHACSYLRNFMTAHAFGTKSHLLGPYEVYNVQSVVRRLILSKCGVWNIWSDDLLRLRSASIDQK